MSLRTVGLGKMFSTIQSAVDDLITAVGSTTFTEAHSIEVYDGYYAEQVTVSTIKPTATYKAFIKNATGNYPVLDGAFTIANGIRVNAVNFIDISGFEVYSYTASGIICNTDCNDVAIHSNFVHRNVARGVYLFVRCKRAKVYNNIITDNGSNGFYTIDDCEDLEFYNNTLYNNSDVSKTGQAEINEIMLRDYNVAGRGNTNAIIKNNIIMPKLAGKIGIAIYDLSKTGLVMDNNCFYTHGLAHVGMWGGYDAVPGVDCTTLVDWKAQTGTDTNSIEADPLLVNKGGEQAVDYKLTGASPCRNIGQVLSSIFTAGFFGRTRGQAYVIPSAIERSFWHEPVTISKISAVNGLTLIGQQLSMTPGYDIPTTTEMANWDSAYSLSHNAVTIPTAFGLTLVGQVISLSAGYVIPTTTEQTNWQTAYTNNHVHDQRLALETGGSPTFVTVTATGDLKLPAFAYGSAVGYLYKGTQKVYHDFTPSTSTGTKNEFFAGAGNITMPAGANYQSCENIGIGQSALGGITLGYQNVGIGREACRITTGTRNVGIGIWALRSVGGGSNNMGIGMTALSLCTGSHNMGMGYNAGTACTSGSYNSFIGSSSGAIITTGSYNIAIGYNVNLDNATANYQMNIGNIIKGSIIAGREYLHLPFDKHYYFGVDKDAYIQYDGTNLVIDPKAVGTGYLSVLGNIQAVDITLSGIYKIAKASSSNPAYGSYVTGDADYRLLIDIAGKMIWGDGTNPGDTNLYRASADTLKTDDAFESLSVYSGVITSHTSSYSGGRFKVSAFIVPLGGAYTCPVLQVGSGMQIDEYIDTDTGSLSETRMSFTNNRLRLSGADVILGSLTIGTLSGILKGSSGVVSAVTPLAGTKTYYVSDSNGGTVDRKLTFIDGILTSET